MRIYRDSVLSNCECLYMQQCYFQTFIVLHKTYRNILKSKVTIYWQDLNDEFCGSVETQFGSAERDVTARLIKFSPAQRLALNFTGPGALKLLEADTN